MSEEISPEFICPLYALVVGIDSYISDEIPDLRGCVNDAEAFRKFLVEKLHVPDSHILLLTNAAATRSAIISSFQSHLTSNIEIQYDDAIVIFFAGHGSRVAAPDGWISPDGQIETICPHDERTGDNQGEPIHGIPDRTINGLLHELSTVKGNNITVIMDSCHSGGITRQCSHDTSARSVNTTRSIPATLDISIWTSRLTRAAYESIPPGFQHKFMESHVLMAACRQGQRAHESISDEGHPCGFFTNNLVKLLQQVALNRVTYSDLFDLLPTRRNQKPHCEGTNKDKILFRGKLKDGYTKSFWLVTRPNGRLEVNAGRIHGVGPAAEFIVVDQNATSTSTRDLGVLAADSVHETFSVLIPRPGDKPFIVPAGARAVVSNWKSASLNLKIFIKPGSRDQIAAYMFPTHDPLQPQCDEPNQDKSRNFVLVKTRSEADVVIWLDSSGELVIERLDTLISKYANPTARFALQNRFERLADMLDSVAHFNTHLGRYHGRHPLGGEVKMELYRLTGPWYNRTPDTGIGNLLIRDLEDEVPRATLVVDENARYGVAMVNHTPYDLFPYLFYFDPFSYSIESWYEPTAPLRGHQGPDPPRVTSGYGAGGGFAYEFTVPSGHSSDTGFLKLFVSVKPVDLLSITQKTLLDPMFRLRRDAPETCDAWIAAITVNIAP